MVDPSAINARDDVVDWSLVVEAPQATRVYNSVSVAVRTGAAKVEKYAGAEWADRMPVLFERTLIRAFENSGRILAVGERTAQPVGTFVLQTDIRRLEFEATNSGLRPQVEIYARLSNGRATVYDAKLFAAQLGAKRGGSDAQMAALNTAATQVIDDVVNWALDAAERATNEK